MPWALGGDARLLQRQGRAGEAEAERAGAREHLPRQGHALERPGDRRSSTPGAKLPATKITPVLPQRFERRHVRLQRLPRPRSAPSGSRRRASRRRSTSATGVGGKGNDGVAAAIGRTDGALGYLAISYVFANKLDYALIRNAAGKFPVPGPDTITAAADAVKTIPPDNAISITNPPASAPDAYPISTFTYVLFPTTSGKAKTLRDFVTYAIGPGQKFGAKLQFAPLPAKVVSADKQTLAKLG